MNKQPVKLFVAYSQKDEALKDDLLTHLAGLRRLGLIADWHDRCIDAGDNWNSEILKRLDEAEIILLLISHHFLASDYCMKTEMDLSIRKHINKTAIVIPVILTHVEGWEDHGPDNYKLGTIEALPQSGRPVTDFDDHNLAWKNITSGIRQSLYRLKLPTNSIVEPRQEKGKGLINRLVSAEDFTVIGLTNEVLVKYIDIALTKRREQGKGFWNNLTIIFSSPEFLSTLPQETDTTGFSRSNSDRLVKLEGAKNQLMRFLLSQGTDARSRWTCREYPNHLPFVGTLSHTQDKSNLRVAMILPGIDQKDAFYMELENGHPYFEQLSNTFDYVREKSRRLIEWVIRGNCDISSFEITGLSPRTHIDRLNDTWTAVVIIMLHHRNRNGHYMLLQKRSKYNAGDQLNRYSNISGMVTDVDLLRALEVDNLNKYLKGSYLQNRTDTDAWHYLLDNIEGKSVRLTLDSGSSLSEKLFYYAAIRELEEELGFDFKHSPELVFQQFYPFKRPVGVYFLFGIFTLELDYDQVTSVQERKPHINLQLCSRKIIDEFHDNMEMNQLLQVRYEEIFVPLFKKLDID